MSTHMFAVCHRNLQSIFKFIYVAFPLLIEYESLCILKIHIRLCESSLLTFHMPNITGNYT
jgi:hypothetical protein